MQAVMRKSATVVIAAVVVFMMLFPVPIGVQLIDRVRAQKAEAIPALAVPVILGTACAAGGLLVAGASTSVYNSNLDAVYQGMKNGTSYWSSAWSTYCTEKGGFDAAMQSAVTIDGQSIDLQVLTDAGFFDTLNTYSVYLVNNGDAVVGSNSADSRVARFQIGSYDYQSISQAPAAFQYAANRWGISWSQVATMRYYPPVNSSNGQYQFLVNPSSVSQGGTGTLTVNGRYYYFFVDFNGNYQSPNYSNYYHSISPRDTTYWLNSAYDWSSVVTDRTATETFVENALANVKQEIIDGVSVAPTSTVEPFNPTAEQLAEGYSSDAIVEAINSGNETTTGIADDVAGILAQISAVSAAVTPLAGLLSPLAGIATTLTGIASNVASIWTTFSGLASSPFSWLSGWWGTLTGWWNTLLTWLGATPFGNVMGTVISGVQAIPGAISGAAADVLVGVQAIPLSIADVVAAVNAGVLDLTGALEAVMNPQFPNDSGETVGIALPSGTFDAVEFDLSGKVPFCYLTRTQSALSSMFSNFSGNRSFYFDLEIPYGDTVRFDGEPVLSIQFGVMDIAQTIRVLVTGVLCLGLLYRTYKILERQTGGA